MNPDLLWRLPRLGGPTADRSGHVIIVPITTHEDDDALTRLWLLRGEEPAKPITSASQSSGGASVAPDGSAVAFVRSVDDTPQLHVMDLDGGEAVAVTDHPLGVTGSPTWLPDGSGLLVVMKVVADDPTAEGATAHLEQHEARPWTATVTERREFRHWHTWFDDDEVFHIFHVPRDGGAPRDLTPTIRHRLGWWPFEDAGTQVAVSDDGTRFAWCGREQEDAALQRLWTASLDNPTDAVCLTPDDDTHAFGPSFLPDGRIVIALPREPAPYAAPCDLVALAADGSRAVVWDAIATDHQPSEHAVMPDGQVLVTTEHHARTRFELVDPTTGARRELPAGRSLGGGLPTERGILAVQHGVDLAPRLVLIDEALTVLHDPAGEALGEMDLGRLEERWIRGGNDDDIHVLLLHPPTSAVADPSAPLPLLHLVHGGPHGTFGDVWSWRWHAATFAATGRLVAMTNFHGSTSYGHDFTLSIVGDWASLPTADVEATTDVLVAEGLVDPTRMALTGGSYGGYLVSWLGGVTDRYACIVAHAAVTDLFGMYASDVTTGMEVSQGGTPWDAPANVLAFSPTRHLGNYVTPTLVVHGGRDHRVPIDQGLAFYGMLKAKGVTARLVHYPDEHHWILGKANSLHWYGEFMGWIDRFLAEPSSQL